MNKEKLITAILSLAVCASAVAYTVQKNQLLVFLFAWIIGTAAALLIHFICFKKILSRLGLIFASLLIALIAGFCVYRVLLFLN